MKSNKIILVLSIIFVWSAVLAMPATAAQNMLYFSTDNGSVPDHCESIDIDLMADVDESNPVIATSVNITFDPNCVEITNWDGNTAIWTEGITSTASWSLPHGFLLITTVRMESISGNLNIGTLTLHSKCTEDCETCLKFSTGEFTTEGMETLYPIFNNEIFNCTTDSTIDDDGKNDGDSKSNGGITTNPTTAPSPGPTTSPNPMPTSILATAMPATTSNPAPEDREKLPAPGFGPIISAVMLIAAVYLIRK